MPRNSKPPIGAVSQLCGGSSVRDSADTLRVDAISGLPLEPEQACRVRDLKPGLADYLLREYPSLKPNDYIDKASIEDLRRQYVIDVLREDKGELTTLESEVAESIATRETLAENTELEYDDSQDFGGRVADWVARVGGSWSFIIFFGSFLAIWMITNVLLGTHEAFDAYPFVLLNLVLSTIAAFQAPVIMMSQRRQEAKDRLRATNDYQVNLKAELEIRRLHEKVDHLISRQWKKLDEMQSHVIELSRSSENQELAKKGRRLASRGKTAPSVSEPFIANPEEPSL
jgi:uncharacterized membrane protein